MAMNAIGLLKAPGVTDDVKRVAFALIGHHNRRTGRCDPSIERLMKLLGLSRSMVLKATGLLCSPDVALFTKESHGGFSHRASYTPQWERLAAIDASWRAAMSAPGGGDFDSAAGLATSTGVDLGAEPSKVHNRRRSRSTTVEVQGPQLWTQTLIDNPNNKPVSVGPGKTEPAEGTVDGHTKWGEGPAWEGAHRRVKAALQQVSDVDVRTRGYLLEADGWARSINAELSRRGSGLSVLLSEIGSAQMPLQADGGSNG